MTYHYSVYGLRVRSSRPLGGARPCPEPRPGEVDVDLTFDGRAPLPPGWQGLSWRPVRELHGEAWSMTVSTAPAGDGVRHRLTTRLASDETEVLFSPDGSRVSVRWSHRPPDDEARLDDLASWVLDAVLGLCARLRGWPVLHASSVAVRGGAIGLAGHKGAGKSTLAAAFLAEGAAVLADDHVAVREEGGVFSVQPGPPALKLWASSLPVLPDDATGLPRAYSYIEKLRVDLDGGAGRFHDAPLPLLGLYLLEPRDPSRGEVAVEPVPDAEALHRLLLFRWSRYTVTNGHAASELDAMARLVRAVPVRRVRRPDGLGTLAQVVRAIREDASAQAA